VTSEPVVVQRIVVTPAGYEKVKLILLGVVNNISKLAFIAVMLLKSFHVVI